MKIHLFQQCLIDMFYPHVGMAGVEVLERLGCELVVPKKQVCCGQMFTNSGYNDAAMDACDRLATLWGNPQPPKENVFAVLGQAILGKMILGRNK